MLEKCDFSGKPNSRYVTKIQVKGKEVENEPTIAEYIRKTIPKHNMFYAPVIEFSPVNTSLEKEFISSKIRCVGENTLEAHLLERIFQDPYSCLSHLLDTHLYLTLGVEKMVLANLVHLHIKRSNVLFDNTIQSPIMTEFGWSCINPSFTFPILHQFSLDTCLEIYFISNMVNLPDWETKKIETSDWNKMVETYFESQEMRMVPDSLKQESIKNWKNYIRTKFADKNGKQIWSELVKSWDTWDNYSVLVIFASILYRFKTEEKFPSSAFLDRYHTILLSAILNTPENRDTPTKTMSRLDALVHSLDKEDYKNWIINLR